MSCARLLQGVMSASTVLAVETGRRRPPQKLSSQLLRLVNGEAPSAQEQVYWDLMYAYRASMLQLVLATATAWEQKTGIDAATWDELWGQKNRSERFEWSGTAEDGLLGIGYWWRRTVSTWILRSQNRMEPKLTQALPQSPLPGELEIVGLLRGHLRAGGAEEWVAVPLGLPGRN